MLPAVYDSMRNILTLAAVMLSVGAGCADIEPTSADLRLDHADATRVAGVLTIGAREVPFSSEVTADRVYAIRFGLAGGELGTDVDWNRYTATPRAGAAWTMSAADRADLDLLARALDTQLDRADPVADNLVRQAALWDRHPEGELVLAPIVADRERSWTTLCNGTSYRTFSWTWGSTAKSEYLKYGPGETTNPCRARCGAGCNGVGTSAWTVDCGRHDRCEQYGGSGVNSQCNDELASASDDFSFAGNCSY